MPENKHINKQQHTKYAAKQKRMNLKRRQNKKTQSCLQLFVARSFAHISWYFPMLNIPQH